MHIAGIIQGDSPTKAWLVRNWIEENLLLTPGFSPVFAKPTGGSRFNGLAYSEAVETANSGVLEERHRTEARC
jgi:hypothetical protein